MLTLVLGNNFLVMFVGWEGVGLCSYLLIGYWYEKKSASDAAKKAFIVNRVGDWGFLLGVFLIYHTFGTLDFRAGPERRRDDAGRDDAVRRAVVICLLLFIGATGKSAQIPLYVWLPDAMEGPTPVSALIHAATMVTAGVYMVGRNAVLFSHAPQVMTIVAIVGVLTALMAASIGLVQNDIKKGARVLDGVAARLHVHRDGRRRVLGRRLPPDDARLLQGAAVPRQRLGDPRDGRRAGHAADGWAEKVHAGDLRDDVDRDAGDRRHPAVGGFLQQGRNPLPRVSAQQADLGAGGRHRADDRVLHVPADGDDVLRRLSRPGMGDGRARPRLRRTRVQRRRATHGARIRPIRTRTARRTNPITRSRTARPTRTATHAARDDTRRTRPRPVAWAARIAVGDDVPVDGAGGRRHRRRVGRDSRRRSAAPMRSSISSSRASPRTQPRRASAGMPRRPRADRSRRRREHEAAEADVSRSVELGLMAFSVVIAVVGICRGAEVLRTSRRSPSGSPSASPARTGCCRTSTTSTSCTTRQSSPAHSAPARPVDGRSQGRRRRGQRRRRVTVIGSWFSGLTDQARWSTALVNLVGWVVQESSSCSAASRPGWFRTTRC